MTDASTITYTAPGTGAVQKYVDAFLDQLPTDLAFSTLQAAVTAAAGKTLLVTRAWTSATATSVPANTRIVGYGGSLTISAAGVNALDLAGDGITIENLRIIGPSSSAEPTDITLGSGIHATTHANIAIKGCTISGFNAMGILLRVCKNFRIEGNHLYGNLYNSPRTVGDVSDIAIYSNSGAGKGVISGNFCMSNNSQGIYVNALGHDSDITIVGNVCVATSDGTTEATTVDRRHGIVTGYGQEGGGGRITVVGNVIRNSNSTGIYIATNTNLHRAVTVSGNVISKVGMGSTQAALNGGITIQGGGVSTIVANNAIYDFQGSTAGYTGCITVNHSLAGASCLIEGNSLDTSTADGIMLKGTSTGVQVRGNMFRNIARYDILEAPDSGTGNGGHVIEDNDFLRANVDYPSIWVGFGTSTVTTFIRGNTFKGLNNTTNSFQNGAVIIENTTTTKRVVVERNICSTFRYAVSAAQRITGRFFDLFRVDHNHFEDCFAGVSVRGADAVPVMPIEGNTFRNCTNKTHGGGEQDVAYIARRDNDRMTLLNVTAAPAAGTWIAGDRAEFTAPAAGAAPGAVCTTGGNPGTWKAQASLAS